MQALRLRPVPVTEIVTQGHDIRFIDAVDFAVRRDAAPERHLRHTPPARRRRLDRNHRELHRIRVNRAT
jgi:hypothetical protein